MKPKRIWNYLLVALCFLSPLYGSIALAQVKAPPPNVEIPTTTNTPKPQTEPSPPTTKPTEVKPDEKAKEPAPTPEEIARQQKLIEADRLYREGKQAAAEKLYQEVKPPFAEVKNQTEQRQAITDTEKMPPAAKAYWRISQQGLDEKLESKIFVPLELLVAQYPEFIPGHLRYAQALKDYNRPAEAVKVLERATTLYPDQPDLVKAKIEAQSQEKQWLEASLAARQFAILNPNHPAASEFKTLADENLKRYQSDLRERIRGNAIANIITGAIGYALTGSLYGPLSAIQTTALLLRGETAIGDSGANQAKKQLRLIQDEEVLKYVRELGNKLADATGRNDFKYEFYVVKDEKLNAFALPGGKVFINAGSILKSNSEAELAGLLGHELSHAVLSHGFQLVTQGSVAANVTGLIPYGGILGNLIVLDYSRDMERQADVLGTRLLVTTGYAADGLYNLMGTLNKENRDRPVFTWLSSHPVTEERISSLQELISSNGYNRYAFEGVARHAEIKARVKKLLDAKEAPKDKKHQKKISKQAP